MIRIETIWLALGASDLRGGIDKLLGLVVRGFAQGAQAHHAYAFANRRADRLKVLVYDGAGMWLCTRRLQAGSFVWPREDTGSLNLTREQFEWLVSVLVPRELIERMQAGLKFNQTKIEALNFEIARLKRWRFGSSSESLESTTQAVLFDRILAERHSKISPRKRRSRPSPRHRRAQKGRRFARHCPRAFLVWIVTTSSSRRTAPAAKPSSASAKRSASNWTACRLNSSCCATSAASTPARAVSRSRPRRCRLR